MNDTESSRSISDEDMEQAPPFENGKDLFPTSEQEKNALNGIFALLLQHAQIDFSNYRQTTVLRRLYRRMGLRKTSTIQDYLTYLGSNHEELSLLHADLLLSFTEFFRDPHIFEALETHVYPHVIKNRTAKDPIRIWVPGCSTGEEVYSLAISVFEFLEKHTLSLKVQLFGTDLVEKHIVHARTALYEDKIRKNISSKRLERFFDRTPKGLKVAKFIREMCVFATQNITQDPPFANIDLVSCRNVLIYFSDLFQETAIPLFHFALKEQGFLLLGSSESMGKFPDLFKAVDPKANIYIKRSMGQKPTYTFPISPALKKAKKEKSSIPLKPFFSVESRVGISRRADEVILSTFAPASILVDSTLHIRQFRGQTFPYLQPTSGEASLKLSKMAGEELMPDLYVAIEDAKKTNQPVVRKNVSFKQHQRICTIDFTVVPLDDTLEQETFFLIVFSDSQCPDQEPLMTEPKSQEKGSSDEVLQLRQELQLTKKHLQSIIEEKDDVNQDLWAANEEVQSTNEELQSVNEEMEAAKEELESSNEELISLNEELHTKNIELIEAKDFAENIVETANTIVLTVDPAGTIVTFNKYAEVLTGYDKGEVVGRNWFDIFIPAEEKQPIMQTFAEIFANKSHSMSHENTIVTKEGSHHLISWSNNVIRDNTGKESGILSIGMDITQQRQAQRKLQESQEKLNALFENMTEIVALHEIVVNENNTPIDYRITDCNKAFTSILGIPKEKALGKLASEVYQSTTPPYLDTYASVAITGEPKVFNAFVADMNKHLRISVVSPRKNQFATITSDISKIKETEKALIESESRFRSYVESAPDGIFVADESGIYIDVNRAACNMTGFTRDELLSMSFQDLIHPEDREKGRRHFNEVVNHEHASGEFRFIRKDKTVGHWFVDAVRLSTNRFLGFTKDITEYKSMEDQLRQSTKMEAVGQLAGGIAHDFNNQLAGILGYADILREEVDQNSMLTQFVDNIILGVRRASDLTSELLAFSRKGKYLNVSVGMHRIIFEVVNLLQHSIDKKINIHQDLRAQDDTVMGDPTQLQNAILNIALNARDAMPDGGDLLFKTSTFEATKVFCTEQKFELEPGRYLEIKIEDTGKGIEKSVINHIFEPFFTTKEQGKGTGMGLAAVYGTVKTHRGGISVSSAPQTGTKITLFFPLFEQQITAQPIETCGGRKSTKERTVLLVEDEEMICNVASRMLEKLGYFVSICNNGHEAVSFYKKNHHSIDLIILDMVMPEMGGKETFFALKEINPKAKVLISSGYSIEGDAQTLLNKGANGFIQKPFRKGELSKKICDILA